MYKCVVIAYNSSLHSYLHYFFISFCCMWREIVANLKVAPFLLCHYQCCAGWKCALTLHNTVKWQTERQIKVQLQSKQSISLFFSNFFPFSHSAACEIGPSYCWMREKGFLGSLLFDDSSGFCLPLRRCPFLIHWNWSPDICTLCFIPISHRIFWSQQYEREIYYYSVHAHNYHNMILVQPEKPQEWLQPNELEEVSPKHI